jgi:hypothetical protein
MASRTQKQSAFLGLLLAILVVVMMRSGEQSPAGTEPAPSNSVSGTTGTRQAQRQAGETSVVDVQLEALKAPREEAPNPERNLFRFEAKAPPPPPSRAVTAPPSPTGAVPSGPVVPTGPPPPPPIPLKFIGVINATTQAGRIAILADGRGGVFQGREGDIIEGRYRLLRIGPDNVELAYTDGRGRQLIRLAGQ